jgi:DNA polymerase-3 subunit delta'
MPSPSPSPLVPLYGHERLRERFADATARGVLPASMLLHGPRGVGKQRVAIWLGQMLLCAGEGARPCGKCSQCRFSGDLTHPDLRWIFPRPRLKDADPSLDDVREDYAEAIAERVANGGLYAPPSGSDGIYVATVRAIVRTAAMSPALALRKVFVIGDAERMVPQEGSDFAANAFLKLLEEPPADTTIVLTSSEPGGLLPTIRSRVVGVRVAPISDAAVGDFLADPIVKTHMRSESAKSSTPELIGLAAGAPGRLLAGASLREATQQAQRLLDAATSPDRAGGYRVAFAQGAARARGSFTDTLDALEVLLHRRVRAAVASGNEHSSSGAAKALEVVERIKEQASGNVNPQLLTASLIREMTSLIGPA